MALRSLVNRMIRAATRVPVLGSIVVASYQVRLPTEGWSRQHPFDREHGVDTSGTLPDYMLVEGPTAYGSGQPSIIRTALAEIPDPHACHFVDLGCGKGRPLLVATEFGFSALTRVEFSPVLARVARSNAAVLSRAHPRRKPIEIITGDALAYRLPEEPLVIFLYNPFHEPLMAKLVDNIEASLRRQPRDLYLVHYKPVWAALLDGSGALERRHVLEQSYDPGELGFGPNVSDTVVIWHNRGNTRPRPAEMQDGIAAVASPHPDART